MLTAEGIAGEACYDGYISEFDVAMLAKEQVVGKPTQPKHQIVTEKLRSLGMRFGGVELLKHTIEEFVQVVQERLSTKP